MKIAILGWGSLIWEKTELAKKGEFKVSSLKLPLEFSRISVKKRKGALTLVIDVEHIKEGEESLTQFVESSSRNLVEAIRNLAQVEEITSLKNIKSLEEVHSGIGFLDCKGGQKLIVTPHTATDEEAGKLSNCLNDIQSWAEKNDFEAVIWTNLRSNFDEVRLTNFSNVTKPYMEFSVDNAKRYLNGLRPPGDKEALKYIKMAPKEVKTPLRNSLQSIRYLLK